MELVKLDSSGRLDLRVTTRLSTEIDHLHHYYSVERERLVRLAVVPNSELVDVDGDDVMEIVAQAPCCDPTAPETLVFRRQQNGTFALDGEWDVVVDHTKESDGEELVGADLSPNECEALSLRLVRFPGQPTLHARVEVSGKARFAGPLSHPARIDGDLASGTVAITVEGVRGERLLLLRTSCREETSAIQEL